MALAVERIALEGVAHHLSGDRVFGGVALVGEPDDATAVPLHLETFGWANFGTWDLSCGTTVLVTEPVVGAAGVLVVVTRTVFSLSVNTVAGPFSVRAQPSGTFTVKPLNPLAGRNTTYAWLSGMSPGGLDSVGAGFGCAPPPLPDVTEDPVEAEPACEPPPEHPQTVTVATNARPAAAAARACAMATALLGGLKPTGGRS